MLRQRGEQPTLRLVGYLLEFDDVGATRSPVLDAGRLRKVGLLRENRPEVSLPVGDVGEDSWLDLADRVSGCRRRRKRERARDCDEKHEGDGTGSMRLPPALARVTG